MAQFKFVFAPEQNVTINLPLQSSFAINFLDFKPVEKSQLGDGIQEKKSKINNCSIIDIYKHKYLTDSNSIDFGRVTKSKSKIVSVYRLTGYLNSNCAISGFYSPLQISSNSVKLARCSNQLLTVTLNQGQSASFLRNCTIGEPVIIQAKFGLLLNTLQQIPLSKVYSFQTAVGESVDGTEERTAMLGEPVVEFKKVLVVDSSKLQGVLAKINTARDSVWLLAHGDVVNVEIMSQTSAKLISGTVFEGDMICLERSGKIEDEIIEVVSKSGSNLTIKNYMFEQLQIGKGLGRVLKPFQIIEIVSVASDGNKSMLTVSCKLLES